jgi:hypothetical protein
MKTLRTAGQKRLASSFSKKYFMPLLIVAGCAIIGLVYVYASHAATPAISAEPEAGTLASGAVSGSASDASGGKYVNFAASTIPPTGGASSTNPCVSAAAPAKWNHVIVLMFENKVYSAALKGNGGFGPWFGTGSVPYTTGLLAKCGTYTAWQDADYTVTGSKVATYVSKPNYALLTDGVPATTSGVTGDGFGTTTGVDNIYNRLNQAGKNATDYYSGPASTTPCASSNFVGAYHDAIRYYTNLGGQSSTATSYCNTHDKPLTSFMTDVNAGKLPAFTMILPTNNENGHDNSISTADTWSKNFLTPLLDSAQYKSGDTAIFFLWDEDANIPNIMLAPSIKPGSSPAKPTGAPISHYSALRTWQEMLGVTPFLGNTGQAPSLLNYYNGQ